MRTNQKLKPIIISGTFGGTDLSLIVVRKAIAPLFGDMERYARELRTQLTLDLVVRKQ